MCDVRCESLKCVMKMNIEFQGHEHTLYIYIYYTLYVIVYTSFWYLLSMYDAIHKTICISNIYQQWDITLQTITQFIKLCVHDVTYVVITLGN